MHAFIHSVTYAGIHCFMHPCRIPINLPEAKGLRETMSAARKLAESLRNLLPTNREAGRVRRKGEEPVDIELLRAMKVSVFAVDEYCLRKCHCNAELQDRKKAAGHQDGNGSCVTKQKAWVLHLDHCMSARSAVPVLLVGYNYGLCGCWRTTAKMSVYAVSQCCTCAYAVVDVPWLNSISSPDAA